MRKIGYIIGIIAMSGMLLIGCQSKTQVENQIETVQELEGAEEITDKENIDEESTEENVDEESTEENVIEENTAEVSDSEVLNSEVEEPVIGQTDTDIDVPVVEETTPIIVHKVKTKIPLSKINFQSEGKFVGGTVTENKNISNFKWGRWAEFERLVFEIKADVDGKQDDIVPYYEVVMVDEQPLIVVVFGGTNQIKSKIPSLSKSNLIEKIEKIDLKKEGFVSFSIKLKENKECRVFQLKKPNRVVIDIKR